jgi:hypothetical protein
MLLAGGAVATAVSGLTGGTVATATPTADVSQIDAYGYGGGGAIGTAATATLTVDSSETLTQTEANAERSTAMAITPGALVEAELDPATVDWFGFDATEGDPITVEYERAPAVGVTSVVVYGPDGSFKEKLFVGTDSLHRLSTTATTTGTHFVQVIDIEEGDGPYSFTVLLETVDDGSGSDDGSTDDGSGSDDSSGSDDGSTDDGTDGSTDSGQSPYGGTPRTIPGRIQAEEFDTGGQDVAYYDTTETNQGGEFRPDEFVDIEQAGDRTNEYNVGYTNAGEWLEFTVDVTPGTYDIAVNASTPYSSPEVAVSLGGATLGTIQIPDTGDWYNWKRTTLTGVDVSQTGDQILRVEFLDDGTNLNWIRFAEHTDEQDDEYGQQTYGEYEYGGISQ